MNSFTSPLLTVLAKNVGFFAGSILAVLIVLTVYDEDVLTVQHILTAITLLGLVVTLARSFIPDEHTVWCPEQLLQRVLAHVHYMPDHWQGNASRSETRSEMAQLFQYKAVFILEELLSPILTPLILIFALPARALDIVDFFRNFTVEVVGVGDICSFAQLDVRNHGNPQWLSAGQTEASVYQQAENGKTELSLMHFAITNPRWQPPPPSELFLSHLKEKVQQDAAAAPPAQHILAEGPLGTSLLSDDSAAAPDGLLASVLARPILSASGLVSWDRRFAQPCSTASAAASVLASLASPLPGRARGPSADSPGCHSDRLLPEESLLLSESRLRSLSRSALLSEVASAEMSLHAIYLHEVRPPALATRPPAPLPAAPPGRRSPAVPLPVSLPTGLTWPWHQSLVPCPGLQSPIPGPQSHARLPLRSLLQCAPPLALGLAGDPVAAARRGVGGEAPQPASSQPCPPFCHPFGGRGGVLRWEPPALPPHGEAACCDGGALTNCPSHPSSSTSSSSRALGSRPWGCGWPQGHPSRRP